jgi:hypothetical protein
VTNTENPRAIISVKCLHVRPLLDSSLLIFVEIVVQCCWTIKVESILKAHTYDPENQLIQKFRKHTLFVTIFTCDTELNVSPNSRLKCSNNLISAPTFPAGNTNLTVDQPRKEVARGNLIGYQI